MIIQGNLPFDRDEMWRARGYDAVGASPFDPKHLRAASPICNEQACLTHAGKIRYGVPGRLGTGNAEDYPAGRLKMFDDVYADVPLSKDLASLDRVADVAFQTTCGGDGLGEHTCDPATDAGCCVSRTSSANDDEGAALPVNPRKAESLLQQQRLDEERRFYSQSLFNERMADILKTTAEPVRARTRASACVRVQ